MNQQQKPKKRIYSKSDLLTLYYSIVAMVKKNPDSHENLAFILYWIVRGKTMRQIAAIMDMHEDSVRSAATPVFKKILPELDLNGLNEFTLERRKVLFIEISKHQKGQDFFNPGTLELDSAVGWENLQILDGKKIKISFADMGHPLSETSKPKAIRFRANNRAQLPNSSFGQICFVSTQTARPTVRFLTPQPPSQPQTNNGRFFSTPSKQPRKRLVLTHFLSKKRVADFRSALAALEQQVGLSHQDSGFVAAFSQHFMPAHCFSEIAKRINNVLAAFKLGQEQVTFYEFQESRQFLPSDHGLGGDSLVAKRIPDHVAER